MGGENGSGWVGLVGDGLDCGLENEKVKGCVGEFFCMVGLGDGEGEGDGRIEKKKGLSM